nr:uncharacterized protein LOC109149216 [Ipomoea batatas]
MDGPKEDTAEPELSLDEQSRFPSFNTRCTSRDFCFVEKFAAKTKLLAALVVELVQMVNEAPEEIYDDINFKVVLEAAEKLLGMKRKDNKTQEPTSSQQEEAFWADPAHIAAVEKIENAIMRKRALEDRPSFSLGLTQTQDGQEWHGNINPPTYVLSGAKGAVLGMAPVKDAAHEKRPPQTDMVSANLMSRFRGVSGSMKMHELPMPSQLVLWRWVFNHNERTK